MYNNPIPGTVLAGTGTLAATGGTGAMPMLWVLLGAFALVGAAAAVSRATPKPQA